jgi:hypothetical protein
MRLSAGRAIGRQGCRRRGVAAPRIIDGLKGLNGSNFFCRIRELVTDKFYIRSPKFWPKLDMFLDGTEDVSS